MFEKRLKMGSVLVSTWIDVFYEQQGVNASQNLRELCFELRQGCFPPKQGSCFCEWSLIHAHFHTLQQVMGRIHCKDKNPPAPKNNHFDKEFCKPPLTDLPCTKTTTTLIRMSSRSPHPYENNNSDKEVCQTPPVPKHQQLDREVDLSPNGKQAS